MHYKISFTTADASFVRDLIQLVEAGRVSELKIETVRWKL